MAPLSKVIRRQDRSEPVDPNATYRMLGLLNRGRGVFDRETIKGSDTKYPKLSSVRRGDLVYSRLFAWEGSVAIADRAGWVSGEFPTYEIDEEAVHLAYLGHAIKWQRFVDQLADSTTGLGQRRQRVPAHRFEAAEIPLPDLPTQRRVAARLDRIADRTCQVAATTGGRRQFSSLAPRVITSILDSLSLPTVPVAELYETINDTIHPGMDPAPADRFVGLENVSSHTGYQIGASGIEDLRGRKFRFLEGDVLYGYLRPYLNKVWVADGPGLCSVEQYVLRPQSDVDPRLLGHVLRAQQTLDEANAATHRLQLPRIRAGLLGAIQVPDIRKAPEGLADRLDGVCAKAHRLTTLAEIRSTRASTLLPAARNEEFSRLIRT